jgi:hypothetical protein
MNRVASTLALAVLACLPFGASSPAQASDQDPAKAVTQADVAKVLGGQWKSRVPEPGAIFYEEIGGPREVHVYLANAGGKNVSGLKPSLESNGEVVDDVPGIGVAAMYRPQSNEVDVEIARKGAEGDDLWLSVVVHNVDDKAKTKKFAVELAKLGTGRL